MLILFISAVSHKSDKFTRRLLHLRAVLAAHPESQRVLSHFQRFCRGGLTSHSVTVPLTEVSLLEMSQDDLTKHDGTFTDKPSVN